MKFKKRIYKDKLDINYRKLKLYLWDNGDLSIKDSLLNYEDSFFVLKKDQVKRLIKFLEEIK